MKSLALAIFCLFILTDSNGQISPDLQSYLNKISRRQIRKELARSLIHEGRTTKLKAYLAATSLEAIPILSFSIASNFIKYDSTKSIIQYLHPNDTFLFESAILLKKKNLHSILDCSDIVNYLSCNICNYENRKVKDYKHAIKDFISIVRIQECSFLFNVQFFENTIWFIKNDKIYVYCNEDKVIYGDPDDFIKEHCSAINVMNIVRGEVNFLCK